MMQFSEEEGPTTLFRSSGYIELENMTTYGAVLYTAKVTDNNIGAIDLTTPPATDLSYIAIYWCSQTIHNLTATPHSIAVGASTAYETGIQQHVHR